MPDPSLRQAAAGTTSSSTPSQAFGLNVVAGNPLFWAIDIPAGAAVVNSVADDSHGGGTPNSWQLLGTVQTGGDISRLEIWWTIGQHSAACTVTATLSASAACHYAVGEGQDLGTTPTEGATAGLDIDVAEDPLTCAPLVTTAGGLILTFCRFNNGYNYVGWGDSFTDAASTTRSRFGYRGTAAGVSAAPNIDVSGATEAGESITGVVYTDAGGGGAVVRDIIGGMGFIPSPR